ncbi:LysR family transcriptional regulator [Vibrio sp.]|nr:LysR family transcriptional regulator [Vibrio sp.]
MKQMKALLAQLTDADLRLLRVFIAVVECGGLSAAEMELNIGRSTISRHLKDLELRLGLVLCLRGRAGFSMTPEGRYIYDAAKRLIKSLEDFRHQVNDLHQTLKGRLIIAMFDKTISNEECRVSDAIARYIDDAPDVLIDIHVVPVNQIEKGVLEGEYHVGIIPPHRRSASLNYMPLFGENMFLYCGKGHPFFQRKTSVSDEEIISQRYAGLSFSSPNMGKGQSLGFEKTAEASDQEGIATLIGSGRYIGFLPDHFANSLVKSGMLAKIENSTFSYHCQFTAIHRKSPQPTRLVQLFLNALEVTARK